MEDELTIIYIWGVKNGKFQWIPVRAGNYKCTECGKGYKDAVWDETCDGEPMLVCDCGEQYFTRVEE